ncbi:MAG: SDR family oxidoreductase, partial [Proteobacteria bacterium]|nr:SDR family oxidoreductase [Pseudomonadota bacterium]
LADRALETYGAIDVLVNNAGTNPYFGPAVEAPESAWEKTLGVNLKGYFFMAQAAARVMVRQGGGRIINISSMIGYSNSPMTVIYGITKAGVISMTRALAKELAPHNIRVNAIAPGFVATDFSAAVVENPQLHASVVAGTPLGRIGEADEVAGAAVYLASDASSYVTGAVITVDGGTLA